MKSIILFFLLSTALADVSSDVFIRGKIGNDFNDQRVKITDSLGQTYYLPKKLFPSDFNFKQGESFAIEVSERELDKIKILKK